MESNSSIKNSEEKVRELAKKLPEEGQYIIVTKSRKFEGEFCFLVDRKKCQSQWWTSTIEKAMVFNKLSAAEWSLNRYQHNEPTIVTMQEAASIMDKLNKKSVKTVMTYAKRSSWLERRLAYLSYMMDEHDGGWEHGSNYN